MKTACKTDIGLNRKNNEDSFFVNVELGLLIVADGIGGHQAGEVASQMAVDTIPSVLMSKVKPEKKDQIQKHILEAIFKANEEILAAVEKDPLLEGMGTTVVLAVCRDDIVDIAHVGDSRAYLIRKNQMELVTEDHSAVFQLLKAGKITPEEMRYHPLRHMITQALGSSYPNPDINRFQWSHGDYVLLCSDGLTDFVEAEMIEKVVLNADLDIEGKCKKLIDLAKENGGADNITVILACNE